MKNGIVIPCYNEGERLNTQAFKNFLIQEPNYMCCFVNDGSTDNTLQVIKSIQSELGSDKVKVVDQPQNMGKAEAVRAGALYLSELNGVNTVGFLDADLATGFEDYKNLVDTLIEDEKSFVFGSRKMEENEEIKRSILRSFFSYAMGTIIKLLLGMPIKDTQCGAKVMNASLAGEVFKKSFISKWLFDVEIFFRVKNIFGSRVMNKLKEVALEAWEDVEGSKISSKDAIIMPLMLIKIAFFNLNTTQSIIRTITAPATILKQAA